MSKELAEVIVENGIVYRLGEYDLYYPDLGMPEGTLLQYREIRNYAVGIFENNSKKGVFSAVNGWQIK